MVILYEINNFLTNNFTKKKILKQKNKGVGVTEDI